MKRKTLTILFADLQGFTSRTASQSREDNELLVKELKTFIGKNTANHNGTLVKSMGDGFMLTFESPTDGVACGQEIQSQIEQRNANQENFTRIRIGISTGEVNIDDNGDVDGDAVNISSRIQNFAEPNNVYISDATYLAMNRSGIHTKDLGLKQFKNVPDDVRVYKVLKNTPGPQHALQQKSLSPLIFIFIALANAAILITVFIIMAQQKPDIEELVAKNDYRAILETATEVLGKDPENLEYHTLAIQSFIKLGEYEELENHLKNVLEFHPEGETICVTTADLLGQEGEYQLASELLQKYCEEEQGDNTTTE